eukprot:1754350-Rhodomonas_salina.1
MILTLAFLGFLAFTVVWDERNTNKACGKLLQLRATQAQHNPSLLRASSQSAAGNPSSTHDRRTIMGRIFCAVPVLAWAGSPNAGRELARDAGAGPPLFPLPLP